MTDLFANTQFMSFMWESITIESVLKFAVVYFFVIWIAVIVWVIKDISNRTDNLLLQILSILIVVIFTPLGVFLYLLIRPSRTIFEKYYLEVEENLNILSHIIEQKNEQQKVLEKSECPDCGCEIESDFVICPHCKRDLRNQCSKCKKEIRENWKVCPYCSTKQEDKKHKSKKHSHKNKKTD